MKILQFLSAFAVFALADDKTMSFGGYTARILGRSGKMKIFNSEKSIEVAFESLKELTAEKTEAFQSHGFNSFATQDFTFSDPETGEWPADDCCGNDTVRYQKVRYSGVVSRPQSGTLGDMWVETVLFQESGRIIVSDGEEKFDVSPGVMKWTVGIDNWTWCVEGGDCCNGNSCTSAVGEFLEFSVSVKVDEGESSRRRLQTTVEPTTTQQTTTTTTVETTTTTAVPTMSPTLNPTLMPTVDPTLAPTQSPVEPLFDLGNGTQMVISEFVRVGSAQTLVSLPDFSFSESGNTHTFTFIFPKSDKILYDPIVALETQTTTTQQPDSAQLFGSLLSTLFILFWFL